MIRRLKPAYEYSLHTAIDGVVEDRRAKGNVRVPTFARSLGTGTGRWLDLSKRAMFNGAIARPFESIIERQKYHALPLLPIICCLRDHIVTRTQ